MNFTSKQTATGGTRTMFSGMRKRFTYANVVLTLALVFAMTGGAYAAGKYLITSTKQISPKVLKSLQGKAGPAGKTGPAGTTGAAGLAGAVGVQGSQGPAGANGVSVTSAVLTKGSKECPEGGSEFSSANGKAFACNGRNGTTGFTETLPEGKTETGAWSFSGYGGPLSFVLTPISFPIPLKEGLEEGGVHYVREASAGMEEEIKWNGTSEKFEVMPTSSCPGTPEKPEAQAGNLCVYEQTTQGGIENENPVVGEVIAKAWVFRSTSPPFNPDPQESQLGAGTTGANIKFAAKAETPYIGYGTWALTAPTKKG